MAATQELDLSCLAVSWGETCSNANSLNENVTWSVNSVKCTIGILLPKLFWPTVMKNCSSDRESLWNSRLKDEDLQKVCDHENDLSEQWKVKTIFGDRMLFWLVPGGFSYLKN